MSYLGLLAIAMTLSSKRSPQARTSYCCHIKNVATSVHMALSRWCHIWRHWDSGLRAAILSYSRLSMIVQLTQNYRRPDAVWISPALERTHKPETGQPPVHVASDDDKRGQKILPKLWIPWWAKIVSKCWRSSNTGYVTMMPNKNSRGK